MKLKNTIITSPKNYKFVSETSMFNKQFGSLKFVIKVDTACPDDKIHVFDKMGNWYIFELEMENTKMAKKKKAKKGK